VLGFLLVAVLGALVGVGEIVARYRDAPVRTLASVPALLYLSLNSAAALLALVLVSEFKINFGFPENSSSLPWIRILVSGFGAMAALRSSFFTVRLGEKEVAIGMAALLQLLLDAADRAVDRTRARDRAREITTIMAGISYAKAHKALPTFCLALMQNLSADDQERLADGLAVLEKAKMEDEEKALVLGLELMNHVGPRVLRAAVDSLGPRIRTD